ncbi:MAG TPA: hypothetical protein VHV77_16180 [Pirellulales bacterium]|jgi:hypothetical protein|nr:hypothetical protein [Pirellulales bacterium]
MFASMMQAVVVGLAVTAAPGQAQEVKARNPRVLLITSGDSQHCADELARLNKPEGEFARMRALGWTIGTTPDNQVQIVDREAVPTVVGKFTIQEFPIVLCIDKDEILRSFRAGCTTPLDGWTIGWLLKGIDERPRSEPPEGVKVQWTGNYPLRGNHWSIDGDVSPTRATLVSHLRGPIHGPQIKPNYMIEIWSYEELRSLHDNLHEIEMGGFVARPYYQRERPTNGSISKASGKALGK